MRACSSRKMRTFGKSSKTFCAKSSKFRAQTLLRVRRMAPTACCTTKRPRTLQPLRPEHARQNPQTAVKISINLLSGVLSKSGRPFSFFAKIPARTYRCAASRTKYARSIFPQSTTGYSYPYRSSNESQLRLAHGKHEGRKQSHESDQCC